MTGGAIEISVSCAGTVVPLLEEVVSAPINSRIVEVYKNTGDSLRAGEPILKLELSEIETQYRQKLDEREMMASKLVQLRVRTRNTISELEMQQQVASMQLDQYAADLEGERYLHELGAGTADNVRRAELVYKESKYRLDQLAQKIENERSSAEAELRLHELELSILEKTIGEQARLLNQARVMSPRNAILTFINNQVGSQVGQGERLAVISDLSSYKIEAEVAERHREKLSYGAPVLIHLPVGDIPGRIQNINPAAAGGVLNFTVVPDDPGSPGLASGMKIDVDIIFGFRQDVLRVPNGKWYEYGRGDYMVWVMDEGMAVQRRVSAGDGGSGHVEIISGLSEGERIIISDMERFAGKKSVKIK
ncbi:MAG: HlyD family efflux transporter periplasmic adaptor subunit [Alistipes sp.]|nr:HlyD family efflux transporter periplasmic adaptor subunit [Alistipes sp.]